MATGNQNFTLYTRVQFDNKTAVKATEELKKTMQSLKVTYVENDRLLKEMLAHSNAYTEEQIKNQRALVKADKARYEAQKKAVQSAYTDLSMLRKAATELDKMNLSQLKRALAEANKQMNQMGSSKHSKEETQALVEMMTLLKTRINGIQKGFNNLWEAATSGAKMSMTAMEDLANIIDKDGAALARNEQHYRELMVTYQKLQIQIANSKGFNILEDKLKNGKVRNITEAQLTEYKKFYEGIVNSAKSSAKQVAEAMEKIKLANSASLDKELTTTGNIADRVNDGTFSGSIAEKGDAIKRLQELREKIPQGNGDVAVYENIDSAINKLRSDIDKVKESTILAKTELKKMFTETTDVKNGQPGFTFNTGALSDKSLDQLKRLRDAMNEYKRSINTSTASGVKELEKVQKALVEIDKAEVKVKASAINLHDFRGTNLQTKSLADLKQAYKLLEEEIQHVARNQETWNKKAAQMKEIDAMIKSMNQSMQAQVSFWDKAGKKLMSYIGVYLSFNAVMNKVMQAWGNIVKLSDQMTNVQKVTGMTADEVKNMTNAIQGLDTRTANTELLDLAEQAGKLGFNTADAITQFVKAGQVITNTLGEIGGAESITELLKISDLVNKEEAMDTEESLNRIGSAVLNVGNNSKASYAGVVEFTKRMGAVGATSKLTMPQILALGGTFSSLGGNIESSSTALQRVLIGLQTNTAAVAKATQTNLEELNAMLGEGRTFDALMLTIENIRDKGVAGIDEFLKAIGGRNNTQAKSALTLLAGNLETVNQQLTLAEIGYQDGTLATQEFEKANNNLAGVVERIGNEFYEMGATASSSTGILKTMAQGFLSLVQTFRKYIGVSGLAISAMGLFITKIVTTITMLRAGTKSIALMNIAIKGQEGGFTTLLKIIPLYILRLLGVKGAQEQCKLAADRLRDSIGSIFGGFVVTGIALIVNYFMNMRDAAKETTKEIGELTSAADAEMGKLNALTEALKNTNASESERKALMDEFNSAFGQYTSNILTEENYMKRLAIAYDEAAAAIQRKTAAQINSNAEQKAYEAHGDELKETQGDLYSVIQGVRGIKVRDHGKWLPKADVDVKNTGIAEVMGRVQALVQKNPNISEQEVIAAVVKEFGSDTRLQNTIIQKYKDKATGKEVKSENATSVFSYGNVQDALKKAIESARSFAKAAAADRQQAQTFMATAEAFDLDAITELAKEAADGNRKEFDRKKDYEKMFKLLDGLSKTYKDKLPEGFVTSQEKAYNEFLGKMKNPWGVTSSELENMGGDDLAIRAKWANEVYKGFKDKRDMRKTLAQTVPSGITIPETIMNGHANLKQQVNWSYSLWQYILKLQNKNHANLQGNYKEDKSSDKKEADNIMDGAMKKLDEFYKRREEYINMQDLTEADRNRRLLDNEKEHLEERINLQKKFFDQSQQFDHDYITALFHDINTGDWAKVNSFLGDRKNMGKAEGVRLNMAKDANKIQTDANAAQKKRDEILNGENSFTKLFTKTQGELDILGLLLPGMKMNEKGEYTDLEGEVQKRFSTILEVVQEKALSSKEEFYHSLIYNKINRGANEGTIWEWMAGLTDEDKENLYKRIVEFSRLYNKEIRKAAKDLKQRVQAEWEENGKEKDYIKQEGAIGRQKQHNERLNSLTGASNVWTPNIEDDQELLLYDLKIQKSNELIEQFKREQQARIDAAKTTEEAARERQIMEQGIAEYNDEIAKLTQEKAEAQADLAFKMIEKFKPYADMVEQFGEDFGGAIFGDKEDRQKAAKALLTSFIKTTGELIKQKLIYMATSALMEKTEAAGSIQTQATSAIAAAGINAAKGTSQEIGKHGVYGLITSAAIGVAISGIIAAILSAMNKGKSELGVSTGKLTTGMLTYAEGRYPAYGDGTVGSRVNVRGNDGKTYNATYKPQLTTGEYSRPHLGIVGESGAELIIDSPTYKLLRRNAPGILQGIYDMHRYGRLSLNYPSLEYSAALLNLNSSRVSNRRVRTYADGNIETALSDLANTGTTDALAPTTDNNARLADAIDRLLTQGVRAHINMYGKDELYESMQKANRFMKGRG